VPDPVSSSSDAELRSHVERVLSQNYELEREIGRGGMGIVYLARDRRLKRQVAIKLLPPEIAFRSEIRTRFLREAETAAQLSHPNIVPIYSVDEREGLVFFIMAYIEGDNLAKRLHDTGPLDVEETRRILHDVADALAYAHGRGVVHRDIKPDNILISVEDGHPMVTDFGIARAVSDGDSRLTATGIAIGTPAYMSPEQSAGDREIDGRSDLYSLGIVGYQMLCGDLPFTAGNTPAMLVKHISERPMPVDQKRAGIPTDLSNDVMRLLEKDPANRFPTAAALAEALETRQSPEMPPRASTAMAAPGTGAPLASNAWSPMPYSASAMPEPGYDSGGSYVPSTEDFRRWNHPDVLRYRKKLAPYIALNSLFMVFFIVSGGRGPWLAFTSMWTVWIAWKYAQLWSNGFDWRDVFKQPRDRMFFDVVADIGDHVRALFDPRKRAELRERERNRRRSLGSAAGLFEESLPAGLQSGVPARGRTVSPAVAAGLEDLYGPHAAAVRQAMGDRNEIIRLIESMPKSERAQVADVIPSADALSEKIRLLALSQADLDRNAAPGAVDVVEREIAQLELQANPLDRAASEERVRRLAYLKRQRRALADISRRREQGASKLESCRLALQNMRLDVLRLRTGAQTYQHVTLIAEQALSLAREVDSAIYVADEMARVTGRKSGGRPISDRA
jgi:serine/threonine protein kinase